MLTAQAAGRLKVAFTSLIEAYHGKPIQVSRIDEKLPDRACSATAGPLTSAALPALIIERLLRFLGGRCVLKFTKHNLNMS